MMDIKRLAQEQIKNAPSPEECDKRIPDMVKQLAPWQKKAAKRALKVLLKRKGCSKEEIDIELAKFS